jgi:hypothetical protein
MVLVGPEEFALARATLVAVDTMEPILDILVKPLHPVKDFLTQYSGITEEMLAPVSLTLADAQKLLLRYICEETYVIGHSLENDFKACRILPHCRILDTSILYPHPAGGTFRHALKYLAMVYLRRKIQTGSHDSFEDAAACADLVRLKLLHGVEFGVSRKLSVVAMIPPARQNGPLAPHGKAAECSPIRLFLVDEAAKLQLITTGSTRPNVIVGNSDDERVRKAMKVLRSCSGGVTDEVFMCWVQLRECQFDVLDRSEVQTEKVSVMNQRVEQLIEACPDNAVILVVAANSKPGNGNKLSKAQGLLFAFVKDREAAAPDKQRGGECAPS